MLILTIEKKWYDMILAGEKKEEYREIKSYYESRLPVHFGYFFRNGELQAGYIFNPKLQKSVEAKHETEICFHNGYSKNSPSFIAKCTLSVGTGREEWGAEKGRQYFILTVQEILKGAKMTENEAIEGLEFFQEKLHNGIFGSRTECLNVAIDALKQIWQYRSIGTVEQCREAKEKCTPKIPNTWGDGCDDEGRIIYDMYDCPNCGKSYEIDYKKYDHCPNCGQAIDWR